MHPAVTCVIINFRTPDLLRRAVTSFRRQYPALPLLLIDNGSDDESSFLLRSNQKEFPSATEIILNRRNLHHGPAMHQALCFLRTGSALFLDSDCEVKKGGFVEAMLALAEQDPRIYAVGTLVSMNKRGFDVPPGENAFAYIRPVCMLLKRDLYLNLPPFRRHGTPCLENMKQAVASGLRLLHFPVEEFIDHRGRGTAGPHGYRLGLRGKLNHLMNRFGL